MTISIELNKLSKETSLLIPGPSGTLEVLLAPAPHLTAGKVRLAVICHPHPLYGGAMTNKVVTTLAKSFKHLGMATLRFNFRGVGKSEGGYGSGEGELDDLLAVLAWAKANLTPQELWLAGFSFGAYVSIRAAMQMDFTGLVSVAPPVNHFPVGSPVIRCPWVVLHGEQDEIVPVGEVEAWVETLDPRPELVRIPEAEHFFHGKLGELQDRVVRKCSSLYLAPPLPGA